jgi:signal recognition particle subunit SRP72
MLSEIACSLLTRLADLCEASNELTAQDKAAELLPIKVQQLCVLSRLGKIEEAQKLAGDVAVSEYAHCSTTGDAHY